jgi:hypothetical protein
VPLSGDLDPFLVGLLLPDDTIFLDPADAYEIYDAVDIEVFLVGEGNPPSLLIFDLYSYTKSTAY